QPCLQPGDRQGIAAQVFRRAFRMHDATPGCHQVDVARPDDEFGAEAVAVLDLAVEEIGDGRKPDMRMRLDVERPAGMQQGWPHPVEEDERTDEPALARRQGAPHREPANVARTWNDQVLDGVAGESIARDRVVSGKEGHRHSPYSVMEKSLARSSRL